MNFGALKRADGLVNGQPALADRSHTTVEGEEGDLDTEVGVAEVPQVRQRGLALGLGDAVGQRAGGVDGDDDAGVRGQLRQAAEGQPPERERAAAAGAVGGQLEGDGRHRVGAQRDRYHRLVVELLHASTLGDRVADAGLVLPEIDVGAVQAVARIDRLDLDSRGAVREAEPRELDPPAPLRPGRGHLEVVLDGAGAAAGQRKQAQLRLELAGQAEQRRGAIDGRAVAVVAGELLVVLVGVGVDVQPAPVPVAPPAQAQAGDRRGVRQVQREHSLVVQETGVVHAAAHGQRRVAAIEAQADVVLMLAHPAAGSREVVRGRPAGHEEEEDGGRRGGRSAEHRHAADTREAGERSAGPSHGPDRGDRASRGGHECLNGQVCNHLSIRPRRPVRHRRSRRLATRARSSEEPITA